MLDSEQTKREKIKQFRAFVDVPDHHDTEAYLISKGWNLERALNDYFDSPGEETQIPFAGSSSFTRSLSSPSNTGTSSSRSYNPGTTDRTRHYGTVHSRTVGRYVVRRIT